MNIDEYYIIRRSPYYWVNSPGESGKPSFFSNLNVPRACYKWISRFWVSKGKVSIWPNLGQNAVMVPWLQSNGPWVNLCQLKRLTWALLSNLEHLTCKGQSWGMIYAVDGWQWCGDVPLIHMQSNNASWIYFLGKKWNFAFWKSENCSQYCHRTVWIMTDAFLM